MNRRAILQGAGAVPFTAVCGGARANSDETEILRLYRAYVSLIDAAAAHPSMDDDLIDGLFLREADEIEDRIIQLPSTCAADFAAKMLVAHHFGDFILGEDDPVWIEARRLVGGLVRALPWG